MNALLGTLAAIETKETTGNEITASIKCKPRCLLPHHGNPPEWLNDATITLERTVADLRMIGNPGESIVLTPHESRKYLHPLLVEPPIAHGSLPEKINLTLLWWKDEKAESVPITIRANGQTHTLDLKKADDRFTADFAPRDFFPLTPKLPIAFEIACDKIAVKAVVLPAEINSGFHAVPSPWGETHRAENPWLRADILPSVFAGGIVALWEKGRNIDHFATPTDRIQSPFQRGGHRDRLQLSWDEFGKMEEVELSTVGSRRDDDSAILALEGQLDDNLRTNVACTLYDNLPLLLWKREYAFGKGDDKDKDDKKKKPKEPGDDLKPITLGFHSGMAIENDGVSGSRFLTSDGERLVIVRGTQVGDRYHTNTWRMRDGWAMIEHPRRHSYILYLMETRIPPELNTWTGDEDIFIMPRWNTQPVRPNETVVKTVGIAIGETAGASDSGAWIACRAQEADGSILCAVVARLRDPSANLTANFTVGTHHQMAALTLQRLPEVGIIYTATARFAYADLSQPFVVNVAGIEARLAK